MTRHLPEMFLSFIIAAVIVLGVFILGLESASGDVGSGSGSSVASVVAPMSPGAVPSVVPLPSDDAGGFINALASAATSGKWKVFAGLFLVGLVYLLRLFAVRINTWFATRVGGLVLNFTVSLGGTVGLVLASDMAVSLTVLLSALGSAAAAAGLWQMIAAWLPKVDAPVQVAKALHAAKTP